MAERRLLKHKEACAYLNVSSSTLNRMVKQGHLSAVKFGEAKNSHKRYDKEELDRVCDSRRSSGATVTAEAQEMIRRRRAQ
jgi:excisionase family DNA binding protein